MTEGDPEVRGTLILQFHRWGSLSLPIAKLDQTPNRRDGEGHFGFLEPP
jgi:hypothetical protein